MRIGVATALLSVILATVSPAAASTKTESCDDHLQMAWLLLQNQKHAAAAEHYAAASELSPDALDPWLGLQAAYLGMNDPAAAKQAGDRALAIDPSNTWARLRQAYALYLLEDFETAERLYGGLVEQNPQDPEALLGLGATRLRQGKQEGAQDCRRAGLLLGADPRVDECLALAHKRTARWSISAGGTYLRYSDPWNNDATVGGSASTSVEFDGGLGFWLGTSYGLTQLRYREADFYQASPGGGLFFRRNGWSTGVFGSWTGSGDDEVHGALVVGAHLGKQGQRLGAEFGGAWTRYTYFSVWQIDPRLSVIASRFVRLWAGPQLIVLGKDHPAVSNSSTKPSSLWSGHLGTELQPNKILAISLIGFYGTRAYFVEEYGLSLWSSSDRFIGGIDARLTMNLAQQLRVFIGWRHHFGDRQNGLVHDFALFGPSIGLHAAF